MGKNIKCPLPFNGNKKNQLRNLYSLIEILKNNNFERVIDLFGGSGIVSRFFKNNFPEKTVIWNDFDNYESRIKQINLTNEILSKILELGIETEYKKALSSEETMTIKKILNNYKNFDYITVSTWICGVFGTKDENDLKNKKTYYNIIPKTMYNSESYLEGLNIIRKDFRDIDIKENDLLILDPPYINTNMSHYSNYWRLKDFLDVVKILNKNRNNYYILFSSGKSNINEFLEFSSFYDIIDNPFIMKADLTNKKDTDYLITNIKKEI